MFESLSRVLLNSPKKVLLWTLLVVLLAGGAAGGLQKRLTMGGYESTGTESFKAAAELGETFKQGEPNLLLLVKDERGVDDPAVAAAGAALTEKIAGEAEISNVVSYWTSGKAPALRAKSGNQALVLGRVNGDFDEVIARIKEIDKEYTGKVEGLEVKTGGSAMMWLENTTQSNEDSAKADSMVFPLVLLVLVIIFGSVIAALLPLAVAMSAMLLSMGVLFGVTMFSETSSMVMSTTTFLGLGLGIDYSLLFVTRYREELRRGKEINEAIRATMHTAGRTVLFSALTVAVAFLGLFALPFTMLRSLAFGCIATALLAAGSTIVLVPALLKWIGPRIDKWKIIKRKENPAKDGGGFWHTTSTAVMKRPVLVTVLVLAFVVLLGLPAANMNVRLPDESVLPADAKSAQVAAQLKADFDSREQQPLQIVAVGSGDPKSKTAEIGSYAEQLSALPGVTRVDALTGSYTGGKLVTGPTEANGRFAAADSTFLSLIPAVDPYGDKGDELVQDVRGAKAPFDVKVGGPAAVSVDTFDQLEDTLPVAALILFVGMFVLLFLLTGSVLLPIKAMLLTGLSLSATFGALVFIFQDGHLKGLVGDFIVTGAITWTVPVMLFTIAFALSMDYEVFMLSRIKEEYDRTGDNELAVASGLERVGKVVTYAALLLSLVFVVLVTSGISYMKAIGLGLTLAIVMDATIIRGALLPATMKLMGRANWWAPGPLRKLHQRFGLHEGEEPPANGANAAAPLASNTR
ncbi:MULTISPECIES: MMPL family transporter [unclassified Streptomyces]|uniref:MMPL family transporter n=1 Tax=unclassified Streptomyces TaxID=2593676 RepID=UPI000DC7BE7A|nr:MULTISPECIES: MMPL family transporter [unclassified Streptomyces]AWZ04271.1 MMPL family transporter [Streptomyces sp. ICC4]AWZ13572.1 MMPL family transporter [Streptomyces sp. ICC1]